jgi:hypothetical protein
MGDVRAWRIMLAARKRVVCIVGGQCVSGGVEIVRVNGRCGCRGLLTLVGVSSAGKMMRTDASMGPMLIG